MIHFVIGTRAQLFKMTPIMLECEKRGLEWRWVYAAQHKETFKQTLDFFGLPQADYTIVNWDTEARTMGKMGYWFMKMLLALPKSKKILAGYTGKQHIVLTHGDTTTTFLGALIGKLTRTHVMHVESGLRSFNLFNPFPEEINRLITFRLSDYYACPGDWALKNVSKYKGVKINTKENTQMDVLRFGLKNIHKATIKLPTSKYVVLSSHRYENVFKKERFEKIIAIAELVAEKYKVLIPLHPVTEGQIDKLHFRKRLESNKNIILTPRLEYENYLKAIYNAEFVMTDGGGNQEELYHLGKPTLLLRDETERQEGLGQTAVISKLDMKTVEDFVKHYKNYQQKPTNKKQSPTNLIVDSIEKYGRNT
jgi:UDP-N-acetylglucosamine 2-epimerase (non-hydrolysing)